MDSRLLVHDRSKQIQRCLRSCEISYENLGEDAFYALEAFSTNTDSACLAFISVSDFGDGHLKEPTLNFPYSNRLTVIVGEKSDAPILDTLESDYLYFCALENLNKQTISQYIVIAQQQALLQLLGHERHFYREMVNSCPDYVFVRDKNHRIVCANTAIAELHNLLPEQMYGKTHEELTGDAESGKQTAIQDKAILESGEPFYQHEDYYKNNEGITQWNRVTKMRIRSFDGRDHFILGVATNLTEWKKNESQLQDSENRYRDLYQREQVLRNITDTISGIGNPSNMLNRVGEQLVTLYGASEGGVWNTESACTVIPCEDVSSTEVHTEGQNQPGNKHGTNAQSHPEADLTDLLGCDQSGGTNHGLFTTGNGCSVVAAIIQSDQDQCEVLYALRPANSMPFDSQDAQLLGSIANQCLVSITKTSLNYKIEHQTYHDSLTGLPNRFNYEQMLETRISERSITREQFSVFFIDLDGFKVINDAYGHMIGDKVLVEVARRLSLATASDGFLARMGGDEFGIIMDRVSDKSEISDFCGTLLDYIHLEVPVDSYNFSISASIGVSRFPEDGAEKTELMRRADSAMYHAKASPNTKIAFFNQEIEFKEKRRQKLEKDLTDALESNDLELHYQPQYDLKTHQMVGVEALARWNHPELGYVPPEEFVSVAENSHLIIDLGDWVIDTALQQASVWESSGYPLKTAINLSPAQCEQPDFSKKILAKMSSIGLSPSSFQVEVTESTLMKDLDAVTQQLQVLRDHGITIAIDDFGTGYSSLGYLQYLPLDVLKIDRTFVSAMSTENPSNSLISVIARMAKGLGLTTVVEGVETAEQVAATASLGCEYAQGWYFAKAMPAVNITALLEQSSEIWNINSNKAA